MKHSSRAVTKQLADPSYCTQKLFKSAPWFIIDYRKQICTFVCQALITGNKRVPVSVKFWLQVMNLHLCLVKSWQATLQLQFLVRTTGVHLELSKPRVNCEIFHTKAYWMSWLQVITGEVKHTGVLSFHVEQLYNQVNVFNVTVSKNLALC